MPPTIDRPAARTALRWLPAALAVLLLALLPLASGPFAIHLGVLVFLAVLMGSAWNLVGGYAGQYSLGHAAYFGVGAYTASLLLERLQVPPWYGLPAAMLAAALVGVGVGCIAARLRGPSFVLASIAVAEIARLTVLHFRAYTYGAEGLVIPDAPTLHVFERELDFGTERSFYWLTLALAIGAVLVSRTLLRARLGHLLLAIREDEDAARALGIRVAWNKGVALAISAALTGLAGGVFAGSSRFLEPSAAFSLTEVSVRMALVCLIGGIARVEGPIIGAAILVPLEELARNPGSLVAAGLLSPGSDVVAFVGRWISPAHLIVDGVLLTLVVLFAPEGVAGLVRRAARRRTRPATPSPVP